MRLRVGRQGSVIKALDREFLAGERAVTGAMRVAAAEMKTAWRADVAASLGRRLSGAIRAAAYPTSQPSMNAAAMVWAKAPDIIGAHETGALIRSANGFWLAIPLPSAGQRGPGRKRITPASWEQRTGRRLRFVFRPGRPALLVDDGTSRERGYTDALSFTQSRRRGRRNVTVPIFVLLPQVKLPKRLNLMDAADRVAARVPGLIVDAWKEQA